VMQGAIGEIIVHPNYNPDFDTSPNSNDFDIALVRMTAAVSLQPVSLLAGGTPAIAAGTQALILGWGSTALDSEGESIDSSNVLLMANQQIVSNSACSAIYIDLVTENMICAGGVSTTDTSDTCQGDSGGPLTVASGNNFVQVGIVSFGGTETGPGCGDPEAPGVYASVAALADFIAQNATDATFTTLDATGDTTVETGLGAAQIFTSVTGTTVTLSWTTVPGATGYILYYAPLFPVQAPSGNVDLGGMTSIEAEVPVGSAFYVAIQAYDDSGISDVFSNIAVFFVVD